MEEYQALINTIALTMGLSWASGINLYAALLVLGVGGATGPLLRRADDASTALPLYTSAVEGSRSTKRKKKSDTQKTMTKDLKVYVEMLDEMKKTIAKKDKKKTEEKLAVMRAALLDYRVLAQIDAEDGGVIQLPLGNAEEVRASHPAATPSPLRRRRNARLRW